MIRCVLIVIGSLIAWPVAAQVNAVPGQQFVWDQPAPNLVEANGYTYLHYDDNATTGVAFSGVVCVEKTPVVSNVYECAVAIPAYTPGTHTVTVAAKNIAGESERSIPLTFTLVVVPGTPTALRVR